MLHEHVPTTIGRVNTRSAAHPRSLFVSSYPPRQCGIATFAEDVREAYDRLTGMSSEVIAINDPGGHYSYPQCVVGTIRRDSRDSYLDAARLANASTADVVNIQHCLLYTSPSPRDRG